MDDLLKSINSEDDAIKLINIVRSVCNEEGFNLNKFISSVKEVFTQYLRTLEKMVLKIKILAANYLMYKIGGPAQCRS